MKVVLDTNVVVSAYTWGGKPKLLLDAGRSAQIELFTSMPLLNELADVVSRRKFSRLLSSAGASSASVMERYRITKMVIVDPVTYLVADPDDDAVLGTASAAKAELIVSGDYHLLTLEEFRGTPILRGADALAQFGVL